MMMMGSQLLMVIPVVGGEYSCWLGGDVSCGYGGGGGGVCGRGGGGEGLVEEGRGIVMGDATASGGGGVGCW